MNRTFHKRITIRDCVMAVMLVAMSFWCFWIRTGAMPVFGFALLVLATMAIERLVHTTYTFTADGLLTISNGHLVRPRSINVADITGTRTTGGMLLVASHIAIEYGAGHIVLVQPDNEKAFLAELHRRLDNIDNSYKK